MPLVDVMDSTWVRARPQAVGAIVADAALWPRWWPGLTLVPTEFRGDKGVRWDVTAVAGSPGLTGTAELYLQAQGDGVVAHFFLRLDVHRLDVAGPDVAGPEVRGPEGAAGETPGARDVERLRAQYRRRTKRVLWTLGDQLDPGRLDRHTSATHASLA